MLAVLKWLTTEERWDAPGIECVALFAAQAFEGLNANQNHHFSYPLSLRAELERL
jgi:hypothetical protein